MREENILTEADKSWRNSSEDVDWLLNPKYRQTQSLRLTYD